MAVRSDFGGAWRLISWTLLLASVAINVDAQQRRNTKRPRIEIDVHGGFLTGGIPSSGTAGTFPPGQPFTATTFLSTVSSRAVSSWYFGDGSALLNSALTPNFSSRITSLDAAVTRQILERSSGGAFGIRVDVGLSRTLSLEVAHEVSRARSVTTPDFLQSLNASSSSFRTAWSVFLTPFGTSVTSDVSQAGGVGRQTFTTVGLRASLPKRGRLTPYVAAGIGQRRDGTLPALTLRGEYRLAIAVVSGSVAETDTVVVRATSTNTMASAIGGGVTVDATPHVGFRLDARALISRNTFAVELDASPSSVSSPSGFTLVFIGNPSVVVGNSSSLRGSLSGPVINGLETFKGSGREVRGSVTAGVFVRF